MVLEGELNQGPNVGRPSCTALAPMFASLGVLFVLFWSTGFVAARFGFPYAEPFTFLGTRFVLASVLLLALCFARG